MGEDEKVIIRRLYAYLKRFVLENNLRIDIIFVISMIIYGDTTEYHQKQVKGVLGL